MNRSPVSLAFALALGATLAAAGPAAQAFDLTVEVIGTRSSEGFVAGAVHAGDAGWPRGTPVQQERVAAGKAVLVYRGLPAGRYAVSVFHDENGNARLDANVMGVPIERYGFSRDAMGRMGPPAFADAAIELAGDSTITIHLR